MENCLNLTNHFLIATDQIRDSIFANSVIYVCRHNSDGAFGLILNKPSGTSGAELLKSLEIKSAGKLSPVLQGGPVKPEQVFILHSLPGEYDVTIRVGDSVGVTMSKDILSAIAENRAPQKMQFALGYVGWDSKQLEQEIRENVWITVAASSDIIFDLPPVQRLGAASKRLGFDINHLSSDVGQA